MDKQQARNLIKETFEKPFEKDRFSNFIKNLLNQPEDAYVPYRGNYVPDAYKPYISLLERLYKYSDGEHQIDILVVQLKKQTSLERARTMQRNFIAWYLNGSRGGVMKDAALVAFVSPNSVDWRFSLVKMDYRFEEQNGKPKVKEEFTPARRWSFLVGANEKSHTAQSKFVPILEDDENNPALERLEDAFNIEKVTKEFFEKYRDLFIRTKAELDKAVAANPKARADFQNKGIDTVNLAKKLLGQMIFLYFLQKKGWFGVPRDAEWGEGSKNFLRELFAKKRAEENFFNDILEPLFYEALRIDRSHDDHYYSRFNCKIPFLNGGLFDPMHNYDWVHTDILLPDTLFSNKKKTKEGDEGDGVLDVFDRYNFTVKEDEPFEKEVAIDPELLGKAYEKFNAIRLDNYDEFLKAQKSGKKGEESKFNKQYGVYYTPREIVHYMCQQSLVNYLHSVIARSDSDEAIPAQQEIASGRESTAPRNDTVAKEDIETLILRGEQIKEHEARVDAAGKETDTYSYQMPESIRRNAALIDRKIAEIKICDPAVGSGAFPVGMMSEIVRARDVLKTWTKTDKSPYDFKRECIENSLYGVDIDSGAVEIAKLRLWLSLVVDEDDPQNIKPLPNLDYKIMPGNSLLGLPDGILLDSEIKAELEQKKKEYFYVTNPNVKQKMREEISGLFSRLVESAKQYDPTLGNVNFDYHTHFSEVFHHEKGFDIVIGNPPYINVELVSREIKNLYAKKYSTFYKRYDVFGLFFELGLKSLVKQGTVTFIVPSQVLNNLSFKKLRELILKNQWLGEVFYLGDKIFDTANNDVCVLFLFKPKVDSIRLVNALDFENHSATQVPVNYFDKFNGVISFSANTSTDTISDKIFNPAFHPIRKDFEVFQGIVTGNNNVYILTPEQAKRAKIEKELLRVVLLGRDFEKWHIRSTQRQIIYLNGDTKIKDYPNAEQWLLPYKNGLKKRRECVNGVIPWFALQWARDKSQLDYTPKILVQGTRNPRLKTRIVATLDTIGVYGTQGVNFILPKHEKAPDIKYLLAVLNSALINYLFQNKFLNVAIKAEYLKDTPIPAPTVEEQKPIIKLVERVLAAKRANPQADTSQMEKEIDRLVYRLYGLTEEEIKIVEGKQKP